MNLYDNLKVAKYPPLWMNQKFILRSSQMGRCLQGQILNGLGFRGSFTATTMALMDMGTSIHEIIQRTVPAFWKDAKFEIQIIRELHDITLRSTADIVHGNDGYEIKTHGYKNNYELNDDSVNKPWRWQIELTHRLSGLDMHLFTTGRPFPLSQATLLYIKPDDELWHKIKLDVVAVALHRSNKTLPGRPEDTSDCTDCGYARTCASINIGHLHPWDDIPSQLLPDAEYGDRLSYIKIVDTERDKYPPEEL